MVAEAAGPSERVADRLLSRSRWEAMAGSAFPFPVRNPGP
jgi:hypothetical protein